MGKLIGYARVSTRRQDADRQVEDLLAAGVRRDDLYVDHGVSGTRASRPKFDKALTALEEGDTLCHTLGPVGSVHAEHARLRAVLRDKGPEWGVN